MIKVGITGGIGSGKSLIASLFRILGIPIYNSDDRAKELMQTDVIVRKELIELLGDAAFTKDGNLNRAHIASVVFTDTVLLEKLNDIVHPAVGRDYEKWLDEHRQAPYTIKEAALIFEAGIHKGLDYVISVIAPDSMRIERVMQRDQVDESKVRARMDKQWKDPQRIVLSDYVIVNDGQRPLIKQVMEVHKILLERARNSAE